MMGRILHIGLGNFARAHLADYTQDAGGWSVTGVSLRKPDIRDGLRRQGFDYDLWVQGQGAKRITVIDDVLVAPENPEAVLGAIADPGYDILSATVTEKGYHLDNSGGVDLTDPVIAAELDDKKPRSLIGYLAFGLARREAPITVMSCDNQVSNGEVLGKAVADFAKAAGLEISVRCSFPNSMVDRITPATSDALKKATGDPMAVATELFREWVIEDAFAGPRPDWPDVQIVEDVSRHELRKLRMLNGAHSFLAYAGLAAGHEFVHQAIADPALRRTARALMAEAAETLPEAVQAQAGSYAVALIQRFGNPGLNHALRQIAMDGSQKIPYRIVGSIRDRQAMGKASDALSAALLGWAGFCISETAEGRVLDDPRANDLAAASRAANPVHAVLDIVGASDLLPPTRE